MHGHRLLERGQVLTSTKPSCSRRNERETQSRFEFRGYVDLRFKLLFHFGVLLFRHGVLTFGMEKEEAVTEGEEGLVGDVCEDGRV